MLLRLAVLTALAAVFSASFAPAQVGREMEPELSTIELPILDVARTRPEALFAYLTDPATPYAHALAAAERCRVVFPLASLGPLFRARCELLREQGLHLFGYELPKVWAGSPGPRGELPRERHLLGRVWTLPTDRPPYPRTFAEAEQAAWPWRVCQVLERTAGTIQPLANAVELPRTLAWLDECSHWRIDDDDSAEAFFEATRSVWHTKTLPVLARWRRILLDPRTPNTAVRVANELGWSHYQQHWGDAECRLACQLIAADCIRESPHRYARHNCCYHLRPLARKFVLDAKEHEQDAEIPVEAVIAAAALATQPDAGNSSDAWERLYVQVFSICEAVRDPPFASQRDMRPESPHVAASLAKFAKWWTERGPGFQALARERAAAVTALRARLVELAR